MSTEEEKGVYILKSACADDSVYLQRCGVDTHYVLGVGRSTVVAPVVDIGHLFSSKYCD